MAGEKDSIAYLTLDPGVTIGWACWKPTTCEYKVGHIHADKIWFLLETAREKFGLEGPVIYESFQLRHGLGGTRNVDLTPVEVIGIVKEWGRQKDWKLVSQTPAEGKFYFTDERLKERGLWVPGKKHGMDALRHLLYFRKAFVHDATQAENERRRRDYENNQV